MECYGKTEGSHYTIGNRYIERTWEYDGRSFHTVALHDKMNGRNWSKSDAAPKMEFCYEGLTCSYRDRHVLYEMQLIHTDINPFEASYRSAEGLEVVFTFADAKHGVDIKWHAVVYEDAPAIRTYIEFKCCNLPMGEFYDRNRYNALDSYALDTSTGKLTSYEFFTRTDLTNTLVCKNDQPSEFDKGNLLFYHEPDSSGFFILKESPCFTDERPETDGNFFISDRLIHTLGWGVRPEECYQTDFLRTYGSVIGFFRGGYYDALISFKKYQACRAAIQPEQDCVVMVNPWGDRQCYEHMSEEFVIRELKAAAALGATHYQLDDGWQKGEGLIQLVNNMAVDYDYWDINEERFPNGFTRIAEVAGELGVELALWFAPDFNKLFRNYREQAEILYTMYRKYGIRRFKIDAVKLRTKEAEDNLEKFLDGLRKRTNGDITFNLDTTADPRAGYFMFQEYGNIFLENRYTDWGNYYPWKTLKNLWELSAFVPSERLQIEFLNLNRCLDKYGSDDLLVPGRYSAEYVFALAMFASPLCWFEASGLDEELSRKYSELIRFYKQYQQDIYSGYILPIGDRPSGYSWTGFFSYQPERNSGYLIIFREYNDEEEYSFDIPFIKDMDVSLDCLTTGGESCFIKHCDGGVIIHIGEKNSFRLYKVTYTLAQ